MRVGHGFDVHRFSEGDHVVLGGVKIPFVKGIEAHSDGDVVIHALCDALLGACALGDIGKHFPDSDPMFKRSDSRFFLKTVAKLIYDTGYELINLDCTVVCEKPKISKYRNKIISSLIKLINVDKNVINLKGKTVEKLGLIGKEKAIACEVIISITKYD